MKRVYCHKECNLSLSPLIYENFTIGNWYDIIEMNTFYIIYINYIDSSRFYKENFPKHLINLQYQQFSMYFYTEQEYNRIKNLDELLNE